MQIPVPVAKVVGHEDVPNASSVSMQSASRNSNAPPASDEERTILVEKPVMFRNHPFAFALCVLGLISAVPQFLNEVGMGIFTLLFWGAILAIWYLSTLATSLTITTKRSIMEKGLFSKMVREVRHADVRLLEVKQGVVQRMFEVGSISIASSAHGGIEIQVSGLLQPMHIKETVDKLRPYR